MPQTVGVAKAKNALVNYFFVGQAGSLQRVVNPLKRLKGF